MSASFQRGGCGAARGGGVRAVDPSRFDGEPQPDGTSVLVIPARDGGAAARLELDAAAARELRDGIDAAVARGTSGGEGAVAQLHAGGSTVTISAVRGGGVRLLVEDG